MGNKKQLDLTDGNIFHLLIVFILPILAGSLFQQLYTTVDAIIVGRFVGKSGLAAIDSVATLFKFPINFLSGLSSGATILISRYFGSKNEEALDRSVHTAFTIAIILGVICSVAGCLFTPALLHVMAVPEDIFDTTLVYCRIYFAGLWAMTLYNMVSGILRAFGNSKSPFYILILCSVVNIAGDLLFVGVFHLGVGGAAAATILSQIISAIMAIRILQTMHMECHTRVWAIRFYKPHMAAMLSIGMPLAFQDILFPVANSIVQASINTMGTDSIAAWAVCGKLDLLIWLVADAMSPALATYNAQNIGAGKQNRVFKGTMMGMTMSVLAVGFISLLLFLFPKFLGGLFVSAEDGIAIVPLVVRYMRMMAPFYVFYSLAQAFSGACCGMGDTIKPMIITLLCTCGLRVFCIFAILPNYESMECIVWIYIASWIASGLAFLLMFFYKIRPKTKKQTANFVR